MRARQIRFFYMLSLFMIFMSFLTMIFLITLIFALNAQGGFECQDNFVDGICTLKDPYTHFNFFIVAGIAFVAVFIILSSYFQQYILIDDRSEKFRTSNEPNYTTLTADKQDEIEPEVAPIPSTPLEAEADSQEDVPEEQPKKDKKGLLKKKKKDKPVIQEYTVSHGDEITLTAEEKFGEIKREQKPETKEPKPKRPKESLEKDTSRKRRTISHTKEDLSLIVAKRASMTPEEARKFLDTTFDLIFKALKNKEKVSLTNFGTFHCSKLKERTMQVPSKDGETIIPAHHVVRFKGSPSFDEYLNDEAIVAPPIHVDQDITATKPKEKAQKVETDKKPAKPIKEKQSSANDLIINAIKKEANLDDTQAHLFLTTWLNVMQETLTAKDSVTLSRFGTFDITKHKAKKMVVPATKETIEIPPHHAVKFKPSKAFSDHLNKK